MRKTMAIITCLCVMLSGVFNVSAVDEKKILTLSEEDGHFVYSLDENRFMNFTNMVPGGHYEDHLEIVNECKDKSFDLYFQIIPVEQSSIADLLLEHISMEIVYGDEVIYSGRATGKDYQENKGNLQKQILLGTYAPNETKNIDVHLYLDEEVDKLFPDSEATIEDVYTEDGIIHKKTWDSISSKINWEFMIMYDDTPIPVPPQTGDDAGYMVEYAAISGASLSILLLLLMLKHRKQNQSEIQTTEG